MPNAHAAALSRTRGRAADLTIFCAILMRTLLAVDCGFKIFGVHESLCDVGSAQGKLADSTFDFMKAELTVGQADEIAAKLAAQPYTPPPMDVENASVFPTSAESA